MKRSNGGLLSTMLTGGAAEHAADLAYQRPPTPYRPGLIQKVPHLRGHVAEARRRAEDDGIVLLELIGPAYLGRLIEPEARRPADIRWHQFGHPLDDHVRQRNTAGALGLGARHGLDVSVAAVVENQNACHGSLPQLG